MSLKTAECCSTAASITEVLLGGDVVLSLTPQTLNVVQGTRFVTAVGGKLGISSDQSPVQWQPGLARSLSALSGADISRVVVVVDVSSREVEEVAGALSAAGIPHLMCVLQDVCDADAFMEEADAEAVAERLRQLGYL